MSIKAFHVLPMLVSLVLAGCVGSPMERAIPNIPGLIAKNSWPGKPASEAIAQYGEPHIIKDLGDGRQQYLWFDNWNQSWEELSSSYVAPGPGGWYRYNEYSTRTRHYSCSVMMDIDQNKIVQRFDYHDNIRGACSNYFSL